MNAKFSQRKIKQIVSGSLIIWLSGVVFLFCCEMPQVQASAAESCPLAKKTEHCSKQLKAEMVSDFTSIEREKRNFDCCKMLPLVFDKARKIEKIQKTQAARTVVKVFQPVFSTTNRQAAIAKSFHSVITNRENAYLINCVFRI